MRINSKDGRPKGIASGGRLVHCKSLQCTIPQEKKAIPVGDYAACRAEPDGRAPIGNFVHRIAEGLDDVRVECF
jgi:hypothetical protein